LTGDADWPNLATVAQYGISLIDDALGVTLEPVVAVLAPSNTWLLVLQAAGTGLAAVAAFGSAVVAWRAYTFAQEAQMQRQALERHYKTQEAARQMLTTGVSAADRALTVIRRMPKTEDATTDTQLQTFLSAFSARAQVLGAHFPDGDPLAYAVSDLAKAFNDRIGKCRTEHELSELLVQLRLDLGPFIRGPNVEELHRMYQSAIETYKRIVEEREARGAEPAP